MTPQRYMEHYSSRERIKEMKEWIVQDGGSLPDDFDINSISWVTSRIGITDFEGSIDSISEGYLTINVAGELASLAHDTIAVEPYSGKVRETLDELATVINEYLNNTDNKIVVHCAMGVERSPLTVVWYLHNYRGMTLDKAYELVRQARPVAVERRHWIEGYEDTFANFKSSINRKER